MAEKNQPKKNSVAIRFRIDETSETAAKKFEQKDFKKAVRKDTKILLSHKIKRGRMGGA